MRIILMLALALVSTAANAEGNDSDYYLPHNNIEETPQIIDYILDDKHSFNISADIKPGRDQENGAEAVVVAKFKLLF